MIYGVKICSLLVLEAMILVKSDLMILQNVFEYVLFAIEVRLLRWKAKIWRGGSPFTELVAID